MKKPLALIITALLCAGCAPASNTTPATPEPTTATPSAPVSLSAGSGPQAPGGTVPATIGLSWDQESKDAVVEVAGKAMADFARPGHGGKAVGQRPRPLAHRPGHSRLLGS